MLRNIAYRAGITMLTVTGAATLGAIVAIAEAVYMTQPRGLASTPNSVVIYFS